MGREKGEGAASWFKVSVDGYEFTPGPKARWKTNQEGMKRLLLAERLIGGDRNAFLQAHTCRFSGYTARKRVERYCGTKSAWR